MIITDLMEYNGKNVEVHLYNGNIIKGTMQYIPSYCEMYDYRRPKHFYICDENGEHSFRSYHVDTIKIIGE